LSEPPPEPFGARMARSRGQQKGYVHQQGDWWYLAFREDAKLKRAYYGDNPVMGVRMPEMQRKEAHALSVDMGRELLLLLPPVARAMVLVSMTASLNVAELLGLRWKRVNLSGETVIFGDEMLPPYSLAVRENYYRGQFGSVKAKSRRRNVPLSEIAVNALLAIRTESKFVGQDDLVFASRNGTPLNERNLLRRFLKPAGESSESRG
jgi:site-specific recombinase XerC